MASDRLAFKFAGPDHSVIPIPMTREKWFSIVAKNNLLRKRAGTYEWPTWKTEEVYEELQR